MTTPLSREAVLEKARRRLKVVEIAGLGSVMIRSLSLDEATALQAVEGSQSHAGAQAVIASFVDAEGAPLFTADDLEEIATWDGAVLMAAMRAVMAHNALFKGAAEELEKN